MNIFAIDKASEWESLNSNSKLRLYKRKMMLKVMKLKSNETRLTQNQFFQKLGFSDRTTKRYRDDIIMENPYNRNEYRKKPTKSNTSTSQTQTHTPKKN